MRGSLCRMNVGVYVDGYNLYYGGRHCCGRGRSGWRWLDVRDLVTTIVSAQQHWAGARIDRVIYCTARVDAVTNPSAHADQDVYLKAIRTTGSVDHIEYGNYVARTKKALVAVEDPVTHKPVLVSSRWPLMVRDVKGRDVPNAGFMTSYLHLEEKGSDVNLAAHLLIDILTQQIDAAVVVSNDSDLGFPVKAARARVPVGLVNPRGGFVPGDLAGRPTDGVGNHWWRGLSSPDYHGHQLADPAGRYRKPAGW
jgi:uncharacterized LabA/DUF88 family protein